MDGNSFLLNLNLSLNFYCQNFMPYGNTYSQACEAGLIVGFNYHTSMTSFDNVSPQSKQIGSTINPNKLPYKYMQ